MKPINDIPLASELVSAAEAIDQINSLIEGGKLNAYTQICLIRAMSALNHEIRIAHDEIEMAKVRERCGDD